jgi:rRNA maturation protein Rpf1
MKGVQVMKEKPMTREQLMAKAKTLCRTITDSYLELGGVLYQLQESGITIRESSLELGMHYRKAAYLVVIHEKLIKPGTLPISDLLELGWSKLAYMSRYIARNWFPTPEWIEWAKTQRVLDLTPDFMGYDKGGDSFVVVLSKKEKSEAEDTLLMFGARKSGIKYIHRSEAFMRILRSAREYQKMFVKKKEKVAA